MTTFSIICDVYDDLKSETTKISQKAFDVLNREDIANIIANGKYFWFEFYSMGNNCPQYIYDYLKRFIKRKYGYTYLYDKT